MSMPACPRYHRWEDVPVHLKTRTALARLGRRLPRGQPVAAVIERHARGETWAYALYEVARAIPKRVATPAQRAALAAGRRRARQQRLYGLCGLCGAAEPRDVLALAGVCMACQDADEAAVRAGDRAKAARWARAILADPGAVVLDTETTDLDGEIIEMAIMTMQGTVLLETLVRPLGAITPGAQAVHGLTPGDLQEAPSFADLYAQVGVLLAQATRIVTYNAGFDMMVLHRTCTQYGLASLREQTERRWVCAMHWYAQWWREWSDAHGGYRWQPLGGGHRALDDCQAVLHRLRLMAGGEG